jgi:hypothetical protein
VLNLKLGYFRTFYETIKFDPTKIEKLVGQAPSVFFSVKLELLAFADFLENSG